MELGSATAVSAKTPGYPPGTIFVANGSQVTAIHPDSHIQSVATSGLSAAAGVAVDGAGNLFVSDLDTGNVYRVPADGGPRTTVATVAFPRGLALNVAGDLFIADAVSGRIIKVPANGGPQVVIEVSSPAAVAVDAAGDLFVAEAANNRVVELPAGGGPEIAIGTGWSFPAGVAVDQAGNVFVADTSNNRVEEIPAGGGPQFDVATALHGPQGVAVDQFGNVVISDYYSGHVLQRPAGEPPSVIATVAFQPVGIAVFTPTTPVSPPAPPTTPIPGPPPTVPVGPPTTLGPTSPSINAHMSSNKIAFNEHATVVGSITPSRATTKVVVQRRIHGVWSDRDSATVNDDGSFSIRIFPTQSGIYALRVRADGGSLTTRAFYLRVTPPLPANVGTSSMCPGAPCVGAV